MLISTKHRFIFVHIQKTSGSSLRKVLHHHVPDLCRFCGTHDGIAAAEARLGSDFTSYFRFAFVRNPWDRLVSWYTMIQSKGTSSVPLLRRLRGRGHPRLWEYALQSKNFRDFVMNFTASIDDYDGNKNFARNQIDYLLDGRGILAVDFVGRFENIADDSRYLFKRLGFGDVAMPWINKSDHDHYSKYYDDELAMLVGARYERDISTFGYRFERTVGSSRQLAS